MAVARKASPLDGKDDLLYQSTWPRNLRDERCRALIVNREQVKDENVDESEGSSEQGQSNIKA